MNPDFGSKHLTGLAWLALLIAAVLATLLIIRKKRNLGETFDKAVIRYTCYFMWAWEVVKTVRMVNHADFGPVGHYPMWMAPFHICSMGLYAYLIIGSKRMGKLAGWVRPFCYAVLMICASIIMTIPASSGILGSVDNWSLCFENILPYQSWLYHGSLLFVSLYMILSGFYQPRWGDIYRSSAVLGVAAVLAQTLNFVFEGSGADFMMLRYGRGNPLAFLLTDTPALYYLLLAAVSVGGTALVISVTIAIKSLVGKCRNKKASVPMAQHREERRSEAICLPAES